MTDGDKSIRTSNAGFGTRIMAMTGLVLAIIALVSAFYLAARIAEVDQKQSKEIAKLKDAM